MRPKALSAQQIVERDGSTPEQVRAWLWHHRYKPVDERCHWPTQRFRKVYPVTAARKYLARVRKK